MEKGFKKGCNIRFCTLPAKMNPIDQKRVQNKSLHIACIFMITLHVCTSKYIYHDLLSKLWHGTSIFCFLRQSLTNILFCLIMLQLHSRFSNIYNDYMITNQETTCMSNVYLCTSGFHEYSSCMGAWLHLLMGPGLNPYRCCYCIGLYP